MNIETPEATKGEKNVKRCPVNDDDEGGDEEKDGVEKICVDSLLSRLYT